MQQLRTPTEELDRQRLVEFTAGIGCTMPTETAPRTRVRIGGEVRSVRVVPRAGAR